jgi:hypothetical protein
VRPDPLKKLKSKMDVSELLKEIESLKAQLAQLQPKAKPERIPCPRVTSKNSPCKKYCVPGEQTCKVHGAPPKPPKTPKPKVVKQHCTGTNMRGNPCKGKVLTDCTYCERHDPEAPPKQTQKKKKKVAPEHTHRIGVEPLVPCSLCETHGDMFDGGVTEAKWVDEAVYWARRTEQT